jgi:maleylpyruvate isomerase
MEQLAVIDPATPGEAGHARQNNAGWLTTGTELCERVVTSLSDAEFAEPSRLPGWTRAYVIAHIDGNARGLGNLVTWARTGIETPMYTSMEQRDADIEAGALLAPRELRARLVQSSAQLADGFKSLREEDWSVQVRTAQGLTIAAQEVIWLRAREVMIHAVDLGATSPSKTYPVTSSSHLPMKSWRVEGLCRIILRSRYRRVGTVGTSAARVHPLWSTARSPRSLHMSPDAVHVSPRYPAGSSPQRILADHLRARTDPSCKSRRRCLLDGKPRRPRLVQGASFEADVTRALNDAARHEARPTDGCHESTSSRGSPRRWSGFVRRRPVGRARQRHG